jgi:hypothetical protein
MTSTGWRSSFVLPVVVLCVFVAHATAQAPDLQGIYVLEAQASDDVARAIDDAVAPMNFITKRIARSRLQSTNQPPQRLRIAYTASEVDIAADADDPIRTPADGTPVEWTRKDNERFTVVTRWESMALKRTFRAKDGERSNTYTLAGDRSKLTVTVVVTSASLPKPLTYRLVYQRTSG